MSFKDLSDAENKLSRESAGKPKQAPATNPPTGKPGNAPAEGEPKP